MSIMEEIIDTSSKSIPQKEKTELIKCNQKSQQIKNSYYIMKRKHHRGCLRNRQSFLKKFCNFCNLLHLISELLVKG